MKNTKKRMISVLLAAAMMCGIGSVSYAEPQQQETPITVNAEKNMSDESHPEEKEDAETEIAEEKSEFLNDTYYEEAIGLLSYLGIFSGYEDGSMRPDTKITRAEMAAIILRMFNMQNYSEYKGGFSDVDSSHWAANIIQTVSESKVINGMGNGTFAPNDTVTYEQAVTMIVRAMNYGDFAESSGGYPSGYIKVANDKRLTKNAMGYVGEEAPRGKVAKLVYNALLANYPRLKSSEPGYNGTVNRYEETEGITILSEYFNIYYVDGIVMATPNKSTDSSVYLKSDQILFEDKIMESKLQNADDLVAQYCRMFYYDHDGDYADVTALYAMKKNNKTESITIDADSIDEIVTGYEGGTAKISYFKDGSKSSSNLRMIDKPTIVYNDNPFTMANYANVSPKDENGEPISFDDFITPKEGSVRAVDSDTDGKYDILFVDSYETSVVQIATGKRLQLLYPISIGKIIELDTVKDTNLNVTVTRDGTPIELKNLTENDVVSIKANANFGNKDYVGDRFITIEASSDYVEGKLQSVSGDDDKVTAVIDNEEFDSINNDSVIANLKKSIGRKTRFMLNKFEKIAYVQSETAGGLNGGEKYGWIVNLYANDSGSDAEVQMYTQDDEVKVFQLDSVVDFWGSEDITNSSMNELDIVRNIKDGTNGFIKCDIYNDSKKETTEQVMVKLCKYRTNSRGEITRLYLAVDEDKVSEESNALRLDTKDYKYDNQVSEMFAGKYNIEEPVPQFSAPQSEAKRKDLSVYKYRFAPIGEFRTTGDSKLGYHCFMADQTDYAPGISIRLVPGADEPSSVEDYGTADDNRVFVVTRIAEGEDTDGNEMYIIDGVCDGEQVRYTTTTNTVVAQVIPEVKGASEGRIESKEYYGAKTLWTSESDNKLPDVLHKGDLCGVKGSSSSVAVILKMVDTDALAKYIVSDDYENGGVPEGQFRRDYQFSASRDRIIFGYVKDVESHPFLKLTLAVDGSTLGAEEDDDDDIISGSQSMTVAIKKYDKEVTIINVGQNGRVTVDEESTDVFDINNGDYVYMRRFKNDELREIYVIRYEE